MWVGAYGEQVAVAWLRALGCRILARNFKGPHRGEVDIVARQNKLLLFIEDVGRHNAIDTIAGWMWMHGIAGGDKVIYTTGRLTSEMIIKSAQMGIPIAVSRSGITEMGLDVAQRLGLCAIGRATAKRFLCYSAFERLQGQGEAASGRLRAVA